MQRRALLLLLVGALLSSCATKAKTYVAPSTQRLTTAIAKASDTAGRAKAHVDAAQSSATQIAKDSAALIKRTEDLAAVVPVELRGQVAELQAKEAALQALEADLVGALQQAQTEHEQLTRDLDEARAAKADLEKKGAQLAINATAERNLRIAAEKQLFTQKLFGVLWKLGGALVVVAIAFSAFLWITGRIALTGAKIAAKV